MASWIKYVLLSGAILGLIIFSGFMTVQHTSNTRTIAEVEGAIKTALLGEARGLGVDSGISKEEFVSSVVSGIVETQKNHGKTVKVDYVFLDSSGTATEVDESIKSIQYQIEVLGKDGKVQSVARKHLSIDSVGELDNGEDNAGLKTVTVVFEPGERDRSKAVTIPGADSIVGVTVDNGNVSHTVNGDSVTITVGEGTKVRKLVSGELVPEHTKYVQDEDSPNYNKDGYVGTLDEYVVGNNETINESKYVTNQPLEDYSDSSGYQGKLSRYEHSGQYIPSDTKWVTGHTSSNYNSEGYMGTLTRYLHSGSIVPPQYEYRYVEQKYTDRSDGVPVNNPSNVCGKNEYGRLIFLQSWNFWDFKQIYTCGDSNGDGIPEETGGAYRVTEQMSWSFGFTISYEVYKQVQVSPGYDNRVYRYQGNVTKPESNTRVYRYQGEVTKVVSGVENYKYRGYVTRPKKDTRIYEDAYEYRVNIRYRK